MNFVRNIEIKIFNLIVIFIYVLIASLPKLIKKDIISTEKQDILHFSENNIQNCEILNRGHRTIN